MFPRVYTSLFTAVTLANQHKCKIEVTMNVSKALRYFCHSDSLSWLWYYLVLSVFACYLLDFNCVLVNISPKLAKPFVSYYVDFVFSKCSVRSLRTPLKTLETVLDPLPYLHLLTYTRPTHCPTYLNFPILDPLPYLPQPSYPRPTTLSPYPRPTALSPSTFLSSTHYAISLSSTHCPTSLNFPILDPLPYLPQLTYPRPTTLSPYPRPTALSPQLSHSRTTALSPATSLFSTSYPRTHCPICHNLPIFDLRC